MKQAPTGATQAHAALRKLGDPEKAKFLAGYFKTRKGDNPLPDKFHGVKVPDTRRLAKQFSKLSVSEIIYLLRSYWHEERLLALLVLVQRYQKGDEFEREDIFQLYLKFKKHIDNWDLVDTSAEYIVGQHLFAAQSAGKGVGLLYDLAKSKRVWDRRIAVLSTHYFIKKKKYDEFFRLAKILLDDEHDLIHKAVGWMLREVGNQDLAAEEKFLKAHYKQMPRTMLRYAIEKFPEKKRQAYLRGQI